MKNMPGPTVFRRFLQGAIALFCLYVGYCFHAFLSWVHNGGPAVPRPASVEAFLPISALMGLKRYVLTGLWDNVHPAGLVILLAAIGMALLFRKGFCGYVCPVGLASNLLAKLGKKMSLAFTLPRWPSRVLSVFKYVWLAFFLVNVLSMPVAALNQFLMSPYNLTADARMLEFFTSPSAKALMAFAVLAVLGIVFRNFWCRYLCPYGAFLGLFSWMGPMAVQRDADACVHCGKCAKACPSSIQVDTKARVTSPECIGCMACVEACPVEGCIQLGVGYGSGTGQVKEGRTSLPFWAVGAGCIGLLILGYVLASVSGHWDNALPANMLRMLYLRGA
ncbi:MAG: 4Fe-4S binding protein [Desulfovibrio sp.]|uniref:4Fe-4S binding protein n=1 Tax=Desulfovibrio sp. 7SRBS1 TaxID=3378064 RepID=UPI003B3D882A